MKRKGIALALVALAFACALFAPVALAETVRHQVAYGENLTRIAARYGVTVEAIVEVNGLRNPNFVWVGQWLTIPLPGGEDEPSAGEEAGAEDAGEAVVEEAGSAEPAVEAVDGDAASTVDQAVAAAESETEVDDAESALVEEEDAASEPVVHVVAHGENLSQIAKRYGVSATAIARANGLRNPSLIYPGQELVIPDSDEAAELMAEELPPPSPAAGEGIEGKWLEIDLTNSTLTAWQGATHVKTTVVSLGMPWTPTPPGRFSVLSKYVSAPMSGPGYYLPAVPHTMYFYKGYAIHGAYWHCNWGQPMSHGCVNVNLVDAEWFYYWTPLGTPVVSHW